MNKLTLRLMVSTFDTIEIEIDPSTFRYYGHTEGYSWNDPKTLSVVSFRVDDEEEMNKLVEEIKSKYKYNPDEIDRFYSTNTKFEDYESDKRPRINIKFPGGSRGMTNPPEFNFSIPK